MCLPGLLPLLFGQLRGPPRGAPSLGNGQPPMDSHFPDGLIGGWSVRTLLSLDLRMAQEGPPPSCSFSNSVLSCSIFLFTNLSVLSSVFLYFFISYILLFATGYLQAVKQTRLHIFVPSQNRRAGVYFAGCCQVAHSTLMQNKKGLLRDHPVFSTRMLLFSFPSRMLDSAFPVLFTDSMSLLI